MAEREACLYGARLGVYQAHALAGTPGALILFASGHEAIALILAIGALLGWIGWAHDYNLRWRP